MAKTILDVKAVPFPTYSTLAYIGFIERNILFQFAGARLEHGNKREIELTF